jgi:hypothetical protein
MPWLPPELALTIGVGFGWSTGNDTPGGTLHRDPFVDVRVSYRVHPGIAPGIRARGARSEFSYGDWAAGAPNEHHEFELYGADLAATVDFEIGPHVTLVPWAGIHVATGTAQYNSTLYGPNYEILDSSHEEVSLSPSPLFSVGLLLGVHVFERERYRVTIVAAVQGTQRGALIDRYPVREHAYRAASLGAAVRF